MTRFLRNFLVIIVFFLGCNQIQLHAQGQCIGGGCTGGYQYPSATQTSNTNSWSPVATNSWGGEYALYNVTNGSQYEWSVLAADGGSASFNAQLTLLNSTGTTIICFSDDYSALLPKIQWTATFTGTVRVLLNQSNCATNTTNTTISWRCSSCAAGSAPANDNCAGAIALTPGATCVTTAGTVAGATNSIVTGCAGTAEDDVWYKFTTTATGNYTITVAGSASFDAVVDLRSGACNGANVSCADNSNSGGTEVINASLAASTTYYVRVYDYFSTSPTTKTFTICVTNNAFCTPGYSTGTSAGDYINRVQLNTIDNTPGGTGSTVGPSYTDYSAVSTSLQAGTSQTITTTVGTYSGQTVAAWIDYNANNVFEAGEKLGEATNVSAGTAGVINFTIPAGTAAGVKRMRVRDVWSTTGLDPCATYSYGETEDYRITITAACVTPSTPTTLSTSGITVSQAQMNWAAAGGSATVTYYYAVGAASNVTYEANYLFRGTTTSLNAIQAGLSPGTTYYWSVRAETSCNTTTSAYPAAISFTTSCTTPSVPTALATASITTTSATFNWTASVSGSPTITYKWAVYTNNTVSYGGNQIQQGISSSPTVNVFGLTPGTTYWWNVRAVTSCNAAESANAAAISFVTAVNSTSLITWTGSGATTGNEWADANNWDLLRIPLVTDNVIIPNVSAGSNNFPDVNAGGLSINNSNQTNKCKSLTINASARMTLTSTLAADIQGTFDVFGTFNHQPGGNSNLFQLNAGAAVTVKNGAYLNIGSTLISGGVPAGTINGSNDLQISGGLLTVDPGATVFIQDALKITSGTFLQKQGIVSVALNGVGDASDKVSVSSGAIFRIVDGTFRVSGDADGATTSWDAIWFGSGSTIDIQGGTIELLNGTTSSDFTLTFAQATTMYNLIVNKTGKSSLLDGYNLSLNNDITLSAGTLNANGYNITAAGNWINNGTFTSGAGTTTFAGTSKTISGSSSTTFNNVVFNASTSYTLNSAAAVPQATFNGNFTINANATFTLAAANVISLAGVTNTITGTLTAVNNLDGTRDIGFNNAAGTLACPGSLNADIQVSSGVTTLTTDLLLNGDFFANTGTFTMSTHTLTLNGSWTNSGVFTSGTGTVILAGSGKNILGTVTTSFNNLTVNSGASYTLNPTAPIVKINVNGNYNGQASSTMNLASNKFLDLYGSSIILDGTTIAVTDFDATRDIDINNTASLTGSGTTSADLRIFGGTTTLGSDFTLDGNFEIRNAAGPTFVMTTNTFTLKGNWLNNGSGVFTRGTGLVKFVGAANRTIDAGGSLYANTPSKNFYDVYVDCGTTTVNLTNSAMYIANNLEINSGTLSTSDGTDATGNVGNAWHLYIGSATKINSGASMFIGYRKVGGATDESIPVGFSTNTPRLRSDLTVYGSISTNRPVISGFSDIWIMGSRITGTGALNEFGIDIQPTDGFIATQVGPMDVKGDIIIQTAGHWISGDPTNVLTIRGNLYIYKSFEHNGTVNLYGNMTSSVNVTNIVDINSSIFNFYQTGTKFIFLDKNPIAFGEINVKTSTGIREIRQNISTAANLTIESSATLDAYVTSPKDITLLGSTSSWTNNGTFTQRTGTVSFTGTSIQGMGGSNTTTFYNLTVNKGSNSELQFGRSGIVTNNFTLTAGYVLTTPSKLLTLNDNSTVTYPASPATSFVRGPMKKIGTNGGTSEFIFPVGKAVRSARISFTPTATSATNEFTAEYFNYAYANLTPVSAPLVNVTSNEHWILDRSGASPINAAVKLFWEDAASSGINSCAAGGDLVVARWDGATWEDRTNSGGITGTCVASGAGTVKSNTVTSFSPFTFASKSSVLNPLPIDLLTFTAKPRDNQVDLAWSTASEINNDYFNVERSLDLNTFKSIATVKGAGNSSEMLSYSTIDKDPFSGVSYYRLKQTDYDGNTSYSQIVAVTMQGFMSDYSEKEGITKLIVYPNPTQGALNVSFDNLKEEKYQISIVNMLGNRLQYSEKTLSQGPVLLQYDLQNLPPGMYVLILQTSTKKYTQKLILQY